MFRRNFRGVRSLAAGRGGALGEGTLGYLVGGFWPQQRRRPAGPGLRELMGAGFSSFVAFGFPGACAAAIGLAGCRKRHLPVPGTELSAHRQASIGEIFRGQVALHGALGRGQWRQPGALRQSLG